MQVNKINALIEQYLSEKYPKKTFQILAKVDPVSFEPRMFLSVNGKATTFGYIPTLTQEIMESRGLTEEQYAIEFVKSLVGIEYL